MSQEVDKAQPKAQGKPQGPGGKLGGAGLGLAVGGPLGALIGGVAGHFLVDRIGAPFGPTRATWCSPPGWWRWPPRWPKSDGVVLPSEVEAFGRVVHVEESARAGVERLFDLAKKTTNGFEAYARQLAATFGDEPALLEDVLDGLFQIAGADGALHEAEERYLRAVSGIFGFDEAAFRRIAARTCGCRTIPTRCWGSTGMPTTRP